MELIRVGRVARAHGVRGQLRIEAARPGALDGLERLFLGDRSYRVRAIGRASPSSYLVGLEGLDDRDAAEALRGAAVQVARGDLPPLATGELYVADLVGCAVVDRAGAPIGVVREVFHSGAHEVLVVDDHLIPFVEPIVVSVDLEGRRIVCDPPEGLLDL